MNFVIAKVDDETCKRVKLASPKLMRRGHSKLLSIRKLLVKLPSGEAFVLTSTYDTRSKGITVVVEEGCKMIGNFAVTLHPTAFFGIRLSSGQFIEIYINWPTLSFETDENRGSAQVS
jgi:hypothetical protein